MPENNPADKEWATGPKLTFWQWLSSVKEKTPGHKSAYWAAELIGLVFTYTCLSLISPTVSKY